MVKIENEDIFIFLGIKKRCKFQKIKLKDFDPKPVYSFILINNTLGNFSLVMCFSLHIHIKTV